MPDKRRPKVVEHVDVLGVQASGLLEGGNGLVRFAQAHERSAHAVVSLGKIVVDRNRFAVRGQRFLVLALMKKRVAHVVMESGVVGSKLESLREIAHCFFALAFCTESLAQVV